MSKISNVPKLQCDRPDSILGSGQIVESLDVITFEEFCPFVKLFNAYQPVVMSSYGMFASIV